MKINHFFLAFSFIISAMISIISMSFDLWFYISAKFSYTAAEEIDISDVMIGLIGCEFLLLVISSLGYYVVSFKERFTFIVYILVSAWIFIMKICVGMFFYFKEENSRFWKIHQYYKDTQRSIPDKYQAWEIVYYNTAISFFLQLFLIISGVYLAYNLNFKEEKNELEKPLVEITQKIND